MKPSHGKTAVVADRVVEAEVATAAADATRIERPFAQRQSPFPSHAAGEGDFLCSRAAPRRARGLSIWSRRKLPACEMGSGSKMAT